jgi:hypothetical protein
MMTLFTFGMGFSLFSLPGRSHQPSAGRSGRVMVGAGWAMMLPLAGLLSLLLVVWYYWRLLRGFVRELDDKPY